MQSLSALPPSCSELDLRDTKKPHEAPLHWVMMPNYHVHHCCGATRPLWLQAVPPPASDLPEELRCRYMSKRCEKPRTVKKSGDLHRFCAFHRERANRNQRRVDQRRRLLKKGSKLKSRSWSEDEVKPEPRDHNTHKPRMSLDEDFPIVKAEYSAGCHHEATLNDQDITILNALLFDDDATLVPHRSVIVPVPHMCDCSVYASVSTSTSRSHQANPANSTLTAPVDALYVL